ncbi:MAG: hypothetical protein OXC62_04670, partial [Aestuariivita sp.]|nr:hypothetical protein [Aestuariivita sp.]
PHAARRPAPARTRPGPRHGVAGTVAELAAEGPHYFRGGGGGGGGGGFGVAEADPRPAPFLMGLPFAEPALRQGGMDGCLAISRSPQLSHYSLERTRPL